MKRRDFLAATTAATTSLAFGRSSLARRKKPTSGTRRFALNYAPHFGMFKNLAGDDLLDQVKFMADEGFAALQDSGMGCRPKRLQERIRKELDRRRMTMGALIATADFANPTFASGRADLRQKVLREVRRSLEVAERVNAKWMIVVPGRSDHRLPPARQRANAVDLLRRCAELCEPKGRILLLEPLHRGANHPKLLLRTVAQACAICRDVGSPSCKVLFDVYEQQLAKTDSVAQIDAAWDQIGYFQIGDAPGRKEPGTGQVDYRKMLQHIYRKGYAGLLGMEHGNARPGPEGEQAVIDAYLKHDPATGG